MPRIALRALLIVAIALAAATAHAATLDERFDHTYPLQAGGTFALDNVNGDVDVAAWDRAEVRVTATKHVKAGSPARAKELMAALEIRVTPHPGELRVETRYPSHEGGAFSWLTGGSGETTVTYHVDVPRSARLQIETVNADLSAHDTQGGARLKTVNGSLRATNLRGALTLSSVNGAIAVTGATNGVHASTTNGEIDIRLASVAPGEATELASTNGAITLRLPRDSRASLDARTVNGDIESALPVTVSGRAARHLKGQLNGGGPRIEVSTTNGGIRIEETGR